MVPAFCAGGRRFESPRGGLGSAYMILRHNGGLALRDTAVAALDYARVRIPAKVERVAPGGPHVHRRARAHYSVGSPDIRCLGGYRLAEGNRLASRTHRGPVARGSPIPTPIGKVETRAPLGRTGSTVLRVRCPRSRRRWIARFLANAGPASSSFRRAGAQPGVRRPAALALVSNALTAAGGPLTRPTASAHNTIIANGDDTRLCSPHVHLVVQPSPYTPHVWPHRYTCVSNSVAVHA